MVIRMCINNTKLSVMSVQVINDETAAHPGQKRKL
jgi:hypothetical protein